MAVPKIWRKIPEHYNLVGRRCPDCNEMYFPAREVCRECGSFEMEPYRFIGEGEIITYTVIRTPISDPEGENIEIPAYDIPYVLAIVKLREGPNLTAQIVDVSPEDVNIGMQVKVVFRKILEKGKRGIIQYGYKFRPD